MRDCAYTQRHIWKITSFFIESHGTSEMFHIYNANKKMARTLCFVIISVYFTLLWGVTLVWMFLNVRAEFRQHSYYRRVAMAKL